MNEDTKEYSPSGPLDPLAQQIIGFFQADPNWQQMTRRPVEATRAWIRSVIPVLGAPEMRHVEEFQVPVRGGHIGVRVYCPRPQPAAILVWAHGGGFVLGSLDETDNFARALAKESGCTIVSVGYRLAPEHKFPTAVEDVLGAVLWVATRREDLASTTAPIFLGGDSAGANLATVVTRKLRESKLCALAGNVLAYPNTDSPEAPSLRRFQSPFLGIHEVSFFLQHYLPDAAAGENPDFAPLRAPNLDVLPPTLIITAEHDIVTEQAETYGDTLARHGVAVKISRHDGMIHGFLTMDAFFPTAAGRAMHEISDFIAGVAKTYVHQR